MVIFLLLLTIIPVYGGQNYQVLLSERFQNHRGNFSIMVPKGWRKLNQGQLKIFNDQRQEVFKKIKLEKNEFDGVYAPIGIDSYPRVEAQRSYAGRIPEEYFISIVQSSKNILTKEFFEKIENTEQAFSASGKSDAPFYDSKQNMIWVTGEFFDTYFKSKVFLLSGWFPTEEGIRSIHCKVFKNDISKYLNTCKAIINSLQIHDNMKYRPDSMNLKQYVPLLFRPLSKRKR